MHIQKRLIESVFTKTLKPLVKWLCLIFKNILSNFSQARNYSSNLLTFCKFSIKKYIYFVTLLSEITTLYRPDPALFEAKIRHLTRPDPGIWPFFCLDLNCPYRINHLSNFEHFTPFQGGSSDNPHNFKVISLMIWT